MIRVWYSLCISEEDFSLLLSALQDLVTTELRILTEDVMEISADQLSNLRDVWITWLRLVERKGPWVANLRQEAIFRNSGREDGIENYLHAIPKEHRISAQRFFNTGIFPSTENAEELPKQNPTLTGRGYHWLYISEYHYSIPMDVLPFTGWDYSAIKKSCHVDSLPEMYSIYLSQVIHKVVEKLRKNQVKFQFILGDVLNIKTFLPVSLKYDRISTSNLWDYCSLTALLTQFKGFLNGTNPYAVMLTETDNWVRNFMPEVVHVLPQLWGIDDLIRKALQDTQNLELANSSGMSAVVEYFNITSEFLMFLRASLLTSSTGKDLASFKRKKRIPSVKSLVGSLGLHLRDFTRNENTVFPFKWALNCRRVTMLRGFERTLEWKLS